MASGSRAAAESRGLDGLHPPPAAAVVAGAGRRREGQAVRHRPEREEARGAGSRRQRLPEGTVLPLTRLGGAPRRAPSNLSFARSLGPPFLASPSHRPPASPFYALGPVLRVSSFRACACGIQAQAVEDSAIAEFSTSAFRALVTVLAHSKSCASAASAFTSRSPQPPTRAGSRRTVLARRYNRNPSPLARVHRSDNRAGMHGRFRPQTSRTSTTTSSPAWTTARAGRVAAPAARADGVTRLAGESSTALARPGAARATG